MIVYKDKLLKKSFNRSLSCQRWSLHDFEHRISFTTDWAANFGCNRFRIMPEIVSKHLWAAKWWSRCAAQFKSEQTPFPPTGRISFATDWAANFGCNRLRMHAFIWSCCAVWFDSEQTPFPWTGHRLRSAAFHRIQFGTCCFVPMSYFYSETNAWSQVWAKQWALLW